VPIARALQEEVFRLSSPAPQRPLVLIVDDDVGFARSCARLLGTWGYEVETKLDGGSAVERAKEKSFDVILSDINVPDMSGLQILRAIRQLDRDVPVVLMTGGPALESAREAVECGALSYLIKPISTGQLKDVMERAVQVHDVARRERQILHSTELQQREIEVLQGRFDRALDGMWMAFQPIVSWSSKTVIAYEALMRTVEPTLRSPLEVLKAAEALNQIHTLGRRSRRRLASILREFPDLPGIFVNLHVLDLEDEDLFDARSPLAGFSHRIHFEITERAALERVKDAALRTTRLRALGYRIAIDDLGEGYSGLTSFAHLEPEAVKLDMSLIRGIESAPMKRKLVRAMATLCRELDVRLIAEGVETEAERDTLVDLGVDLLQGFLFARPDFPFPIPRM
jgi:EAL domain-containing protein (putative c-di-GMP-specific phosphodiesterase class I)